MSLRRPAPQENAWSFQNVRRVRRLWKTGLLAVAALIAVALAWLQPAWMADGAEWVGYGICHQIPERSLQLLGRPLPLCARCTGTFLGVFLGFGMIVLMISKEKLKAEPITQENQPDLIIHEFRELLDYFPERKA